MTIRPKKWQRREISGSKVGLRAFTSGSIGWIMKLKAQLSETDHDVSLKLAGAAAVEVDGRHYDLEVRQLAPGEYLLINGSNVYKCRVESKRTQGFAGDSFASVVRGCSYDVAVIDPKRLRSGQSSGAHHSGAAEIISPMPGKIVRVLVKPGTTSKRARASSSLKQ